MARRTLLKPHDRQELVGIPTDEDSLIRHYSLSPADRLEIEVRRREHNRLGFALQLCLMRYPGRALTANEALPMPMLNHVAEQVGADPASFELASRHESVESVRLLRTYGDHAARMDVSRRSGLRSRLSVEVQM